MLKGMSEEEDEKAEPEKSRGFKSSRAATRQEISENA